MGKILIRILYCLTGIILLTGCDNEGCTDNQSSIPLAALTDYATGQPISIQGMVIGGIGAPNDSLIVNDASVSQVYLPFRSDNTSTSFFFTCLDIEDTDQSSDTVTFEYDSTPYLAGEDCGVTYRYRIHKVSHTSYLIDSIGIAPDDSVIDNIERTRIYLYFRTELQ